MQISLRFASLAVPVKYDSSAVPFYIFKKSFICYNIIYLSVIYSRVKINLILDIYYENVNIVDEFNFQSFINVKM